MRPVELAADGVRLRLPRASDLDAMVAACSDPEYQRWTKVPSPYTRRDAEQFALEVVPAGWAAGKDLSWAVELDGAYAGGLSLRPDGAGAVQVGFGLGPWARGRGAVPAALRLALRWGFEDLDIHVAHWRAFVGNWASRRAAWKVGFRFEGTQRGLVPQRGQLRDAWVASLLRGEPMSPAHPWLAVPTLTGIGVRLRRWNLSDADAVAQACTDPVTRHWLAELPHPYTRDTALGWIASREEGPATGRALHWAAEPASGGPAVGAFSLDPIEGTEGHRMAEVGYWVHPAARGRGVASEAVRLVAEHALAAPAEGGLGLRRLRLRRAAGNAASGRVAERAGFRPWGVEPGAERLGDGTADDLVWYQRHS